MDMGTMTMHREANEKKQKKVKNEQGSSYVESFSLVSAWGGIGWLRRLAAGRPNRSERPVPLASNSFNDTTNTYI